MYLPSKIKLKHIPFLLLAALLIFLPLKNTFLNVLIFFSKQLSMMPGSYSKQLRAMKRKNLLLSLEIKNFKRLKEENERLKKALNFKKTSKIRLQGAQITALSPSQWHKSIIVNYGKNRGASEGMVAVDEKGNLLGKIVEVKKTHSRLILANDPNFNLPAFIGKDNIGMLKGNIYGAKVLYIEDDEKITAGDKVWLKAPVSESVIDIGEVKKVKKNTNTLFCDIDISLFSQNYFSNEVFIVE